MNKTDLIKEVASKASLTQEQARLALDAVTDAISGALVNGEQVTLIGFGTFGVSEHGERKGRNPQTGAAVIIPAKKVVKFKAGSILSDNIN